MADLKAFFLSGTRNLERDCLSQRKLIAEMTPPMKMKREDRASRKRRERRASKKERKTISLGIRLRIFSSAEDSGVDMILYFSITILFLFLIPTQSPEQTVKS